MGSTAKANQSQVTNFGYIQETPQKKIINRTGDGVIIEDREDQVLKKLKKEEVIYFLQILFQYMSTRGWKAH